jgi:hypothetical protein
MSKTDKAGKQNVESKPGTARQMAHTTSLVKDLDHEGFKTLHDGHLALLVQAIKKGTLQSYHHTARGLGLYEPVLGSKGFDVPQRSFLPGEIKKYRVPSQYLDSQRKKKYPLGSPDDNRVFTAYLYRFPIDIPPGEAQKSLDKLQSHLYLGSKHCLLRTLLHLHHNPPEESLRITCVRWAQEDSEEDKRVTVILTPEGEISFEAVDSKLIIESDCYALVTQ